MLFLTKYETLPNIQSLGSRLLSTIGTETDFFAGLRACPCLKHFHRTHMFKECRKCEEGLECKDDYAFLRSGYWWKWRNETYKHRYRYFVKNLLSSDPALGEKAVQHPYTIPTPYMCPTEDSCQGGIDSHCKIGYKGPLCSVCSAGYYKQLQTCNQCPSKMWIAGQLSIITVIVSIIIAVSVWTTKRKNRKDEGERSLIDSLLSKIKIAIGFYQVTYGILEAFSYVKWPGSLQVIGKYSEILQLNIFRMVPVHCLSQGLQVDAFGNLFAIMTINAGAIGFACVAYGVRKLTVAKNRSMAREEKLRKLSDAKELVYRNLFFVLYITYLSTCYKTASVLPVTCRKLCQDEEDKSCLTYLKADYSIQCHDLRYNRLIIVGYISVAYVFALPLATFVALWRQQRGICAPAYEVTSEDGGLPTEIIPGLRFLYENYKGSSWYWELVEMSRKVIVASGLILIGQETRSYVGLAWVVAMMYGVIFAWIRPIQDAFENRLMTASLAVTVINLGVGAVSRIPAESIPGSSDLYMDTVIVNTLVLGANSLVIGMLACKLIISDI